MAQLASAMHVLARATPHPVAMSSGSGASSRHRVFVYGTLKRGFYNHRLLQEREAKFVGNASTREPMRCLLYTSPSPRDLSTSRMPSSA